MANSIVQTTVQKYSATQDEIYKSFNNLFSASDSTPRSLGDPSSEGMIPVRESETPKRNIEKDINDLMLKCQNFEVLSNKLEFLKTHVEIKEAEKPQKKREFWILCSFSTIIILGSIGNLIADIIIDSPSSVKATNVLLGALAVFLLVGDGLTRLGWFVYEDKEAEENLKRNLTPAEREDIHNLLSALRQWKQGLNDPDFDVKPCLISFSSISEVKNGKTVSMEEISSTLIDSLEGHVLKDIVKDMHDLADKKPTTLVKRSSQRRLRSMPIERLYHSDIPVRRMSRSLGAITTDVGKDSDRIENTALDTEDSEDNTITTTTTTAPTASAASVRKATNFFVDMDSAPHRTITQPNLEPWQEELSANFEALRSLLGFLPNYIIREGCKIFNDGHIEPYAPTPRVARPEYHIVEIPAD